jgi:hypothetical protein
MFASPGLLAIAGAAKDLKHTLRRTSRFAPDLVWNTMIDLKVKRRRAYLAFAAAAFDNLLTLPLGNGSPAHHSSLLKLLQIESVRSDAPAIAMLDFHRLQGKSEIPYILRGAGRMVISGIANLFRRHQTVLNNGIQNESCSLIGDRVDQSLSIRRNFQQVSNPLP